MRRLLALSFTLLLSVSASLAACGGDDDDADAGNVDARPAADARPSVDAGAIDAGTDASVAPN